MKSLLGEGEFFAQLRRPLIVKYMTYAEYLFARPDFNPERSVITLNDTLKKGYLVKNSITLEDKWLSEEDFNNLYTIMT